MRKSREILKNFIRMAFVNIFFLILELAISVLIVLRRVLEEHMAEDSCRKQYQSRRQESLCGVEYL